MDPEARFPCGHGVASRPSQATPSETPSKGPSRREEGLGLGEWAHTPHRSLGFLLLFLKRNLDHGLAGVASDSRLPSACRPV